MTQPHEPSGGGRHKRGGRRRAKRGPFGFIPRGLVPRRWRRKPSEPQRRFLPKQGDHTLTGSMERATDAELIARGIDPTQRPKRRKRLVSRTLIAFLLRWRYGVTTLIAVGLAAILVATGFTLTRDWDENPYRLPTQSAPTLAALNRSIAEGQRYIASLYKPLPNGEAVQSEANEVPLKADFLGESSSRNVWVLLGEDSRPATTLSNVHDSATSDDYDASFDTPTKRAGLTVHVQINWTFSRTQYQMRLTVLGIKEPAQLWLDTTKLATYQPGTNPVTTRVFSDGNQSQLRSLRYTERHATQEAYLYWLTYGHDPKRATALRKFLEDNGYTAGFDLRAPLYNLAADLPDDMPVDGRAYPDCHHIGASSPFAYAYHSKVCLYVDQYLQSGERDPFLQGWAALTILMKYRDPTHPLPEWSWWLQGGTPAQIAVHLQGQWNRTGYGVPKCTPISCAELSGIRTDVFGALEAQLGYTYGNAASKRFADAAASVIVRTQISANGVFSADNGITYTRPGQAGAFLGAWTAGTFQFTQPSTPKLPVAIALFVRFAHPTPLEYLGIVPSNSETSLDALGFLQMYRCAKYHVCT